MTNPCAELRQDMVAFVKGELEPLARARLDSHLARCAVCKKLESELSRGLEQAQQFEPQLEPDHRRRLEARLSPYTESRAGRRTQLLAWGGIGLVAASLLLVVGVLRWGPGLRSPAPAPESPKAPEMAVAPLPVAPAPAPASVALVRSEPTPFVRLVTGGWDGVVVVEEQRVTVRLSNGFMAASFNGGRGRSLQVATKSVVLEVVGTRFLVECEGSVTTVVVAEGRVRVTSASGTRFVAGGDSLRFDESGRLLAKAEPAARASLDDPYLLEHHASVRAPGHKAEREPAPQETWPVLEQLQQAEALANKGQVEAAVTIYQSCAGDAGEAYAPYRQLCRLEMARLLGFKLGKSERARDILKRLVKEERGEVGRQASLAICELDLAANPCRAIVCLKGVAEATRSEPELKREAERLLGRWSEAAPGCKPEGGR